MHKVGRWVFTTERVFSSSQARLMIMPAINDYFDIMMPI